MPGKILIVDALSSNRITLRVKLSAAFYDVVQAASGREAIDVISRERPDIIVASSELVDMPGVAFLKSLPHKTRFGSTPVVMVAAQTIPGERLNL